MDMRYIQVILSSLVIFSVFVTPLQAGCCMTKPAQAVEQSPMSSGDSCCMMKITQSTEHVDQPLAPCESREGECPKCTRSAMSHHGCGAEQLIVTQDAAQSPALLATQLVMAANNLSIVQLATPFATPFSPVIQLSLDTARSLCAQHTLLTL